MTATTSCEVVGVRDAIRALNKVEPGLRREFTNEAKQVAEPAIQHVQESYVRQYPSGMSRSWAPKGRKLFPFDLGKAQRGVKLKVDASREALSIIKIQQMDPGTAAFETAGRKNANPLGNALGPVKPNHSRVLGPAVWRRKRQIEAAMADLARKAVDRVNQELK